MAFKMRGNPFKQKLYDELGVDQRAYNIDEDKYDAWRFKDGPKSDYPNVDEIGLKENAGALNEYLNYKKKTEKTNSK